MANEVALRYAVKGEQQTIQAQKRIFDSGVKGAQRLDKAVAKVPKRFKAIDGGVRGLQSSLTGLGARLGPVGSLLGGLGPVGIAAGAGLAAGAIGLVKLSQAARKAIDLGDDLAKTADRLNANVEAYQELGFAAERSGVDQAQFEKGLEKLQLGLGRFVKDGTGPAAKAIRELQLEFLDANGEVVKTDKAFKIAVDALTKVEDPARRAALAAELFGDRAGPRLANLINIGVDGIEELQIAAREAGIIMSTESARAAEVFADRLTDAERKVQIASATLGLSFAPTLVTINEKLADTIVGLTNLGIAFGILTDVRPDAVAADIAAITAQMEKLAGVRDKLETEGGLFGFFGPVEQGRVEAINKSIESMNAELLDLLELQDAIAGTGSAAEDAVARQLAVLEARLAAEKEALKTANAAAAAARAAANAVRTKAAAEDRAAAATERAKEANRKVIQSLKDELAAINLTARARAIETGSRRLNAEATEDQIALNERLLGLLFDVNAETARAAELARERNPTGASGTLFDSEGNIAPPPDPTNPIAEAQRQTNLELERGIDLGGVFVDTMRDGWREIIPPIETGNQFLDTFLAKLDTELIEGFFDLLQQGFNSIGTGPTAAPARPVPGAPGAQVAGGGGTAGGFLQVFDTIFSLFSTFAAFAHEGRMPGDPIQGRPVPASAFLFAPRLHEGFGLGRRLGPGDMAAIIRTDEAVLSPRDTRDAVGALQAQREQRAPAVTVPSGAGSSITVQGPLAVIDVGQSPDPTGTAQQAADGLFRGLHERIERAF